jgi:D-alanyl-D-alanine carboxypeptidase/D-alanyl-D-alanine-endopeptidase (penicillin-binding protein 4)
VLTGLPVAGFTGSLESRFDEGAAAGRGRVGAKTGTLTGVQRAGRQSPTDGDPMAFADGRRIALADTLDARDGLDDGVASAPDRLRR